MEVFPGKGLSFSMKMEVLLKSWDLTIENVDECESWTGKCMAPAFWAPAGRSCWVSLAKF
jgi:hypothetical protein